MKWSKALLNIVGNATSAILNRPPGAIYKIDSLFDLEKEMLRETLAVMDALKIKVIDLPGSPATKLSFGVRRAPNMVLKPILTNVVAKGRGDKMPSFQIDLMAGKGKTEVIYHNGAIAKAGRARNIATPVNTALTNILVGLARQELDWRDYDGKPAKLLDEVKRFEK
jgi:2-dehydropantoate 2-reductase